MIKERPTLMCGDMVRAILDGRKTQTRRVVNPQPQQWPDNNLGESWLWHGGHKLELAGYGADYVHSNWTAVEQAMLKVCPHGQPGDRLWVKETFYNDLPEEKDKEHVYYRADGECCQQIPECCCGEVGKPKWKPSIFMPRWASRITLEITSVRVESLHQISPFDALKEGVDPLNHGQHSSKCNGLMPEVCCFRNLWDSINAAKHPWSSNPWVWVISFKRL